MSVYTSPPNRLCFNVQSLILNSCIYSVLVIDFFFPYILYFICSDILHSVPLRFKWFQANPEWIQVIADRLLSEYNSFFSSARPFVRTSVKLNFPKTYAAFCFSFHYYIEIYTKFVFGLTRFDLILWFFQFLYIQITIFSKQNLKASLLITKI